MYQQNLLADRARWQAENEDTLELHASYPYGHSLITILIYHAEE